MISGRIESVGILESRGTSCTCSFPRFILPRGAERDVNRCMVMEVKFYEDIVNIIKETKEKREKEGKEIDLEHKVNLVQQFRNTVRAYPDREALMTRHLDQWGEGYWVSKTYRQFADDAEAIAAALLDAGVKEKDMIALQAHTREEWAIIDEAILGIGCVTVCIYPSLAPSMVEYQLNDSGSVVAFVEGIKHASELVKMKDTVPKLMLAIIIDDPRQEDPYFKLPSWMVTYDDFLARGKALIAGDEAILDKILSFEGKINPDDLATIIYTSGTTGLPKGAMLSHWNIASNCIASYWFSGLEILKKNLSFLPLSHSLERMAGHFYPIMVGMCTAFASNLDNLARDLQEVKPDYLTGVPRVFEKIYAYAMQSVN
ncbi:AMP-binding protein, partial [Candidatus Bathyarchaeota archaeon]|nr:AMP-binding protein [Candidatus Bathyarchaeota archaeon]